MGNITSFEQEENLALTQYMSKVYALMCCALLISAGSAWVVANSETLLRLFFSSKILFYGLCIVEVGLVWAISGLIDKMSYATQNVLFIVYSIINGITLASIFLLYTFSSVASTFVICALTFGACSLVGFYVKKDLSTFGRILYFVLIGLVIATVINLIFNISGFQMILNYIGVLLFVGLTVYDTWKLKNAGFHMIEDEEVRKKVALIGALNLYLDFVNLFLYLLRILGSRRD